MNEQDGGLAKHSTECGEGINWEGSRIMGRDARGSGDDRTKGDGEEGVEHLQPDGTVAVDDILVSI